MYYQIRIPYTAQMAACLIRVCAAWMVAAAGANAEPGLVDRRPEASRKAMDAAFTRLYNFDFPGAAAILDQQDTRDPSFPLTPSVRGAALLFGELDRMKILQTEFFADDDKLTGKRARPDPAARGQVFAATADAVRRANARLAADPADRDAMQALCMAYGIETDYTILIEKRYLRSFALSKQAQVYARKLLALDPPEYDAHLTLGSVEYVVGSLNFVFRLFVRFDQIKGSKQQGVESLKKVVEGGRYYKPFAKILLAVIHLREKQPAKALAWLDEMRRDYPENPLIVREAARVRKMVAAR